MDTIEHLQNRIKELEDINNRLMLDTAFGGLTRAGLEIQFERRQFGQCYAIFTDLDGIHALNEQYGYEHVDSLIRNSLTIRHDDLAFFGRWKSGDEIVFIVYSNPDGFISRLQENLRANGLSGTFAHELVTDNDLIKAVQKAAGRVCSAKKARGHTRQ